MGTAGKVGSEIGALSELGGTAETRFTVSAYVLIEGPCRAVLSLGSCCFDLGKALITHCHSLEGLPTLQGQLQSIGFLSKAIHIK